MHHALAPLLADGVIDEVLSRLKSGKEADLWLVQHRGEVLAAKVYKERQARSFRNNAAYKEGRQVRNSRTQRAMDRGSRFGKAAAEEAWKSAEADALHALHAAGVRVPRPVIFYEGVLLMELVVDATGHPAPRLVDATFPPDQSAALYADLRGQAVRMLTCDLVHGDLSPFNVLLAWNGPTLIDFPQVIGAAHNRQAEQFFVRDLESLRRFFLAHDPALQSAAGDAREIWRAYERRELGADFVPSGRPPPVERQRPAAVERLRQPGERQRPSQRQAPRGPAQPSGRPPVSTPPRTPHAAHALHQPRPPEAAHPTRQGQPPHQPRQAEVAHPTRQAQASHQPRQPQAARQDRPGRQGEQGRGQASGGSQSGGSTPPRDRPRHGGSVRAVVVERLGPRAPAAPHHASSGGAPGGAQRGGAVAGQGAGLGRGHPSPASHGGQAGAAKASSTADGGHGGAAPEAGGPRRRRRRRRGR